MQAESQEAGKCTAVAGEGWAWVASGRRALGVCFQRLLGLGKGFRCRDLSRWYWVRGKGVRNWVRVGEIWVRAGESWVGDFGTGQGVARTDGKMVVMADVMNVAIVVV